MRCGRGVTSPSAGADRREKSGNMIEVVCGQEGKEWECD